MVDKKRCENCYYGEVLPKREKLGVSCCMICLLRSNMFKPRYEFHSKDDVCRKWRTENDDR